MPKSDPNETGQEQSPEAGLWKSVFSYYYRLMMQCRISLALLAILWSTPTPVASADAPRPFDVFHRACLAQGPDFAAMSTFAVAQRWEQVALEDFKRLAPLEDPESASGWLPSDLAIPGKVVIGVTRARLDGRPVETCTVAFTSVPIEAFLKAFFDRTDAEKLSEERHETWTSRLYVLVSGDRKQFVKLRYAPSPNGSGPMAASSIAEE